MTAFKRRFGDYLSTARARCEWDALKLTQLIRNCTTSWMSYKSAEEDFGAEAQQFIYKAIYAKCQVMSKSSSMGRTWKINTTIDSTPSGERTRMAR